MIDIANEEAANDAMQEAINTQRVIKSVIGKIDFKLEKRFHGVSIWMNIDDAIELKTILTELQT
jgi:hypothetical protein